MGKFCIGIIMNVFLMTIPNLYVFLSRCNPMPIFFAYIYISYNLCSQKVAMGTNHHYSVWKALKKIHLTCCSLPAVHVILYGYLFHGCLLTPLSSLSTPRPKDNKYVPSRSVYISYWGDDMASGHCDSSSMVPSLASIRESFSVRPLWEFWTSMPSPDWVSTSLWWSMNSSTATIRGFKLCPGRPSRICRAVSFVRARYPRSTAK